MLARAHEHWGEAGLGEYPVEVLALAGGFVLFALIFDPLEARQNAA